ncbi:hypothetical protein pb186bvf_018064 [Paramecium bursaria]
MAIDMDKNDVEIATLYGWHLKNRCNKAKTQELIDVLRIILELDPTNQYYADPLEDAFVLLGLIVEAIEFFKNLASLIEKKLAIIQNKDSEPQIGKFNPNIEDNYFRIGRLLLRNMQEDESLKYLSLAFEGTTRKSYNFGQIVHYLYQNQFYEQCIKICDQYQGLDFQSQIFYKGKQLKQLSAQSLWKLDRKQEAVPILIQANEFYEPEKEENYQKWELLNLLYQYQIEQKEKQEES